MANELTPCSTCGSPTPAGEAIMFLPPYPGRQYTRICVACAQAIKVRLAEAMQAEYKRRERLRRSANPLQKRLFLDETPPD